VGESEKTKGSFALIAHHSLISSRTLEVLAPPYTEKLERLEHAADIAALAAGNASAS
jgi:hypothetical protein